MSLFDLSPALLALARQRIAESAPRRRALTELRRVAQPGAFRFIAMMNRLGAYRSTVQWPSCYTQYFPHLPETGIAAIGPGGALTYYFLPEEFVSSLAAADLEPVRLYGCNGLGAHLQEAHLDALMADPERWPTWRKQLLATCDHPSIVGVSNHLLAVVRRPGAANGSA